MEVILGIFKKLSGEEIQNWTPTYGKYSNISTFILFGSFVLIFLIYFFGFSLAWWLELAFIINLILFIPHFYWEIKTGYRSSVFVLPVEIKGKYIALSRSVRPWLFWTSLIFEFLSVLTLGIFMIFLLFNGGWSNFFNTK